MTQVDPRVETGKTSVIHHWILWHSDARREPAHRAELHTATNARAAFHALNGVQAGREPAVETAGPKAKLFCPELPPKYRGSTVDPRMPGSKTKSPTTPHVPPWGS